MISAETLIGASAYLDIQAFKVRAHRDTIMDLLDTFPDGKGWERLNGQTQKAIALAAVKQELVDATDAILRIETWIEELRNECKINIEAGMYEYTPDAVAKSLQVYDETVSETSAQRAKPNGKEPDEDTNGNARQV